MPALRRLAGVGVDEQRVCLARQFDVAGGDFLGGRRGLPFSWFLLELGRLERGGGLLTHVPV